MNKTQSDEPSVSWYRRLHIRRLLIGEVVAISSALLLSACVGGGDASSSSANSSTVGPVSSVSSVRPPESSSSPSSTVTSSSSSLSSSTMSSESSVPVACTPDINNGRAIYNTAGLSCLSCHGAPDMTGKTPGSGSNPPIEIFDAPFGKTAGKIHNSLAVYIEREMSNFYGAACTESAAQCAENIAAYLYDAAGSDWCETASSSESSLSNSSAITSSSSTSSEPEEFRLQVSYRAVNAGGADDVIAADTSQYEKDAYFSGGDVGVINDATVDIDNTLDDGLFKSHRWGEDFAYEFDVNEKLVYSIEFGFSEFVQDKAQVGQRVFSVEVEGEAVLQDFDIIKAGGGYRKAVVVTIENIAVSADGKLNIRFLKGNFNAAISSIHIKRPQWMSEVYERMCASCHGGPNGEGASRLGDSLISTRCDSCASKSSLESYISLSMPFGLPSACGDECAKSMANYILNNFSGYNGNPEVVLPEWLAMEGDTSSCDSGINTGFTALRRVAELEYRNIIRDLFKITDDDLTKFFPSDELIGNFKINSTRAASPEQIEVYFDTAKKVAELAMAQKDQWEQCAETTESCAQTNLYQLARRAFSRPPTGDEITRLMDIFKGASNGSTFEHGLTQALEALLLAPQFLYDVEVGQDPSATDITELTQYELAGRLAMFLWRSVPDFTLLNAAKNGELATDDQIRAQVERMLANKKAKDVIKAFHKEWLHLEDPDPAKTEYSYDTQHAAQEGLFLTLQSMVLNDGAAIGNLFTVEYDYLVDATRNFYGATGNAVGSPIDHEGTSFSKTILDNEQRGGILTRAPFLRSNDDVIHRGLFVRKHVLCSTIPEAPPNITEPTVEEGVHPREAFAMHTTDPGCAGCHVLMDPMGYAFDHYDEKGAYRTALPGNFNVDATGDLILTDVNGTFDGARELQDKFANSDVVKMCYRFQWFRYAVGRYASTDDECSLAQINDNDGSIKDLIIDIALTDSFRNRRTQR